MSYWEMIICVPSWFELVIRSKKALTFHVNGKIVPLEYHTKYIQISNLKRKDVNFDKFCVHLIPGYPQWDLPQFQQHGSVTTRPMRTWRKTAGGLDEKFSMASWSWFSGKIVRHGNCEKIWRFTRILWCVFMRVFMKCTGNQGSTKKEPPLTVIFGVFDYLFSGLCPHSSKAELKDSFRKIMEPWPFGWFQMVMLPPNLI